MSKLTEADAIAEVAKLKEQFQEILDKMTSLADEHGFHIALDLQELNTGYTYYHKQSIVDMLANENYVPEHLAYTFRRGYYAKPGVEPIDVECGMWLSSSHLC